MVLLIKVLIKHLPLKIPKWLIFLTLLPGGLGDAEDIGGLWVTWAYLGAGVGG